MKRLAIQTLLLTALLAAPAWAQKPRDVIPPDELPPAGMCRVWIDGVPAKKQAAPTDCATAVKNVPANARVIFGEPSPARGRANGLPTKLPQGKIPPGTQGTPPTNPPKTRPRTDTSDFRPDRGRS